MWYSDAIWYQIYSLGMCGAPEFNTGDMRPEPRIKRIAAWIPHLRELGITALYFSPVFQSDRHGYDTRDYYTIDARLGTNDDFAAVCKALHQNGIRVILDGVFNHAGRGFWAFRDVQKNRRNSPYADWFFIDWNSNSPFNDGFSYEGWEGCGDLVKLNLGNPAVTAHLFGAVEKWIQLFHIDGIRLDVAYSLDRSFLRQLKTLCAAYTAGLGGEIALTGETIHSKDYELALSGLVDSCTDYEVYKGLYSSVNDHNFFEVSWSLNRLYGAGGICENRHLLTFLDNHDVSRIASAVHDKNTLPVLYGLLYAVPGIPCIYYGSEWELPGKKESGDAALRPEIAVPQKTPLTEFIGKLSRIYAAEPALRYGTFKNVHITSEQYVFMREHHDPFTGIYHRIAVLVNIAPSPAAVPGAVLPQQVSATDLFSGDSVPEISGSVVLAPYCVMYWKF